MSDGYDVFLSYKREDQSRIHRLAEALEGAGLSVWWDVELTAGERWTQQIEQALAAARCVVVAWTEDSVGPNGEFVRDEARVGKARGVLIPVLLDKIGPPLGFGEVQAVDLTHWSGNPRDVFFQDLCEQIRARIAGRRPPSPRGRLRRIVRRVAQGAAAGVLLTAIGVGFDLFSAQDQLCRLPWGGPTLSDWCGVHGLGGRPTREERVAWEARIQGDCNALRLHVQAFPAGAYRRDAAELLSTRRVSVRETWSPVTRTLALFHPEPVAAWASEEAARSAALHEAQAAAERSCKDFGAGTLFRHVASRPVADTWRCERRLKGYSCAFAGEAVCSLELREQQEEERCGP